MLNLFHRFRKWIPPPKNDDSDMQTETKFRVTYKEPQTSSEAS